MKPSILTKLAAPIAAVVLAATAQAASDSSSASHDIVAVASSAGSFNTLVAALKAAGLVETLQGAGPFTVFAPTDEAFAKLPAGTVEKLLLPENKEQLVAILKFHEGTPYTVTTDVREVTHFNFVKDATPRSTMKKAVKREWEAITHFAHYLRHVHQPGAVSQASL